MRVFVLELGACKVQDFFAEGLGRGGFAIEGLSLNPKHYKNKVERASLRRSLSFWTSAYSPRAAGFL